MFDRWASRRHAARSQRKEGNVKSRLKAVWRGVLAALTSPEAVKKEKSLAVMVAVRVALALGASASLVRVIESLAG